MTAQHVDVLVISQTPPPVHGSTVMTEVLLSTLRELGYSSKLVDRRFSKSVADIGTFSLYKLLSAAGLVGRLIVALAAHKPKKVIFFTTTRTGSFVVDWVLSEVLRLSRRCVINYIHTQGYRELNHKSAILGFMVKRLLRACSIAVCLGPSLSKDVLPWVESSRIRIIENCIDMPNGPRVETGSGRNLLFLSNLIPGKGIEKFLSMASVLHAKYPDLTFEVIGAEAQEGQIDKLMFGAQGLQGRICFHGALSGVGKWNYLRRADALIFTSELQEAQPLTIIEAFAAGTPVIAFPVGGVVDLVEDGRNGFLARLGSVESLISLAERLLDSPDELKYMKSEARSDYERKYSVGSYTTKWSAALEGR